jgi:hypothetical protein
MTSSTMESTPSTAAPTTEPPVPPDGAGPGRVGRDFGALSEGPIVVVRRCRSAAVGADHSPLKVPSPRPKWRVSCPAKR